MYNLSNHIYYFLESVFIVASFSGFKLTVIHNQRIQYEKVYRTLPAAKLAFQKRYRDKIFIPDTRSIWVPVPTSFPLA